MTTMANGRTSDTTALDIAKESDRLGKNSRCVVQEAILDECT